MFAVLTTALDIVSFHTARVFYTTGSCGTPFYAQTRKHAASLRTPGKKSIAEENVPRFSLAFYTARKTEGAGGGEGLGGFWKLRLEPKAERKRGEEINGATYIHTTSSSAAPEYLFGYVWRLTLLPRI